MGAEFQTRCGAPALPAQELLAAIRTHSHQTPAFPLIALIKTLNNPMIPDRRVEFIKARPNSAAADPLTG
ncbi:MAG: hypothetical protein ABR912_05185 [Terracidiphilus sp.]|jgi:hypothetical protein